MNDKTMAEVLAGHQLKLGIRDMLLHCICGWSGLHYPEARGDFLKHQEAALTDAGFGMVAEAKAEAQNGAIGDHVGYVVLELDRWGGWEETNSVQMDTCDQAVGMVRRYQDDNPRATYAVARLELVMISRGGTP